jgi:hypothetical protein
MSATDLAGRLGAASAGMDRVLEGLVVASPEVLEGCAGQIEQVCRQMSEVSGKPGGHRGDTAALAAARQLRTKIQRARRLLDNVYRFHMGWGRLLGARTGGYLPGGQAAPVLSAGRLYMRG